MSRPKIELENQAAVYDYYRDHRQGPQAARFLHGALALAFRGKLGFDTNAEATIDGLFKQGRTVVLASNHVKGTDPCVIAALPARRESLKPLVGNAFIPAKPSIYIPGVRHLVDGLGAIPVWRKKDAKTPEQEAMLGSANRALLATCVAKMNRGEHMAIFPEGTRNKVDPLRVQQLQGGVGLMVCKVTQVEQPAIVPIGIHYPDSKRGVVTPHVWIGTPSEEPFARPREVMDWLPDQLQTAVNHATDL